MCMTLLYPINEYYSKIKFSPEFFLSVYVQYRGAGGDIGGCQGRRGGGGGLESEYSCEEVSKGVYKPSMSVIK